MSTIEPGWYKDPAEPTTQRYWDGEGWIGAPLPVDATPPPGPPPAGPEDTQARSDATSTGPPGGPARPQAPPATGAPQTPPPGGPNEAGPPARSTPTPPGTGQPGTPPGPTGAAPGAPWQPSWPPPGVPLPPGTQLPPGYPMHPMYARLLAPPPRPHGYPLADLGRRLVARLVDIGALIVINALVNGWFIYQFWREFWPYWRVVWQRAQAQLPYDDIPPPQDVDRLALTITLVAAGLWLAYEVPALANRGQTLGKRLLGIKVMPVEADNPLGMGRALRRWNPLGVATLLWILGCGLVFQAGMATLIGMSMIAAVLLFIDWLHGAVDQPLHQSLRDKAAATVVVDVKQLQTGEKK